MGIKLESRSRSDVNVVFQFLEMSHAIRVYNEIYELKAINVINSLLISVARI